MKSRFVFSLIILSFLFVFSGCFINDLLNPDDEAPTGNMFINDDDEYTRTPVVVIDLRDIKDMKDGEVNEGETIYMRFGNTEVDLESSSWEGYNPEKEWTLIEGTGEKTVYAEFKDKRGNAYKTSDTIIFNSSAGIVILSNMPQIITSSQEINIDIDGIDVVSYKYRLDSDSWSDEIPISTNISSSTLQEGYHTLYVIGKRSNDVWSDISEMVTFSWEIDFAPPVITSFSLISSNPTSDSEITFSITANDGTGTGIDKWLINEEGNIPAPSDTRWVLNMPSTYIIDISSSGPKTIYAWVMDKAGNINNSLKSISVTYIGFICSYTDTIGSGLVDGNFDNPLDVAVDSLGNVYVVDNGHNRIQKFSSTGNFITTWGYFGSEDECFNNPTSLDIDFNDNIYVSDTGNNRIQRFDSNGTFISKWTLISSTSPKGIAITDMNMSNLPFACVVSDGRVNLLNSLGSSVSYFAVSSPLAISANFFTMYVSNGTEIREYDNEGQQQPFNNTSYICSTVRGIDVNWNAGTVYFTAYNDGNEANSTNIRSFNPLNQSSGFLSTSYGSDIGMFIRPVGICVSTFVYVADSGNNRIQKLTSRNWVLFKGEPDNGIDKLCFPSDVAIDNDNNLYVVDTGTNNVFKFVLNSTIYEKDNNWKLKDATSNDYVFNRPKSILFNNGCIYVVDTNNNSVVKFDISGNYIDILSGDVGGEGLFNNPFSIAIDNSGNIYVSDSGNDKIKKYNANFYYLMNWGTNGAGNGQFNNPKDISIKDNFFYVVDSGNNRIQKFNLDGTFISSWGDFGNGNGEFNNPIGIAIDNNGFVYVSDSGNHRIQTFNGTGQFISKYGFLGEQSNNFNFPSGIAISGNIMFVSDTNNNRIQQFSFNQQ